MVGWFNPAISGPHTFRIAADDNMQLWLGSTEAEASDAIASVPGWTRPRQWNKYLQQTSLAVELHVGHQYYIRTIAKEGGGGDNAAVGVTTPDSQDLNPIPVTGVNGHQYLFWKQPCNLGASLVGGSGEPFNSGGGNLGS